MFILRQRGRDALPPRCQRLDLRLCDAILAAWTVQRISAETCQSLAVITTIVHVMSSSQEKAVSVGKNDYGFARNKRSPLCLARNGVLFVAIGFSPWKVVHLLLGESYDSPHVRGWFH